MPVSAAPSLRVGDAQPGVSVREHTRQPHHVSVILTRTGAVYLDLPLYAVLIRPRPHGRFRLCHCPTLGVSVRDAAAENSTPLWTAVQFREEAETLFISGFPGSGSLSSNMLFRHSTACVPLSIQRMFLRRMSRSQVFSSFVMPWNISLSVMRKGSGAWKRLALSTTLP